MSTNKKVFAVVVAAMLLGVGCTESGNFFIESEKAFGQKNFSELKKYYENHPEEAVPDMCFKLNNNEYLATVTATGRALQGLYYYNAKEKRYGLYEDMYIPNISVKKEFVGKNNKRYVLFSWSNLSHGDWTTGYDIFNLVPKANAKSFEYYNLLSVSEDPESGLCGEWSTEANGKVEKHKNISQGKTESIEEFNVIGQGTENVRILFSIVEQDCATSQKRKYTKTFGLKKSKFIAEN